LVDLPDKRSYFLYHAYNKKENVFTGRQGMLGEIIWQENGWPVFASGPTPATTEVSPFGKPQGPTPGDFADSFDSGKLAPSWQWDNERPPVTRLADGQLQLTVSESTAPSPAGTIFGLRLQKDTYTFIANIDPAGPAREGVGIYGDAKSALALRIEDKNLALWKVEKGEAQQLATVPLPEGNRVQLRMSARGHQFSFAARTDGKEWKPVGAEVDGGFLPPWDRAPRAGLIVAGKPGDSGKFDSAELRYGQP
jgi:beta-xylosidase